jgi:demethylmenaquinone methyltransferase/2-methoxy-6-polyprenyl-1,4-benzoquinol methylase
MRRLRRKYYDHFSRIYDRFVSMHSSDKQGSLREFLVEKTGVTEGSRVLDICTGTASLPVVLEKKTGKEGLVVGIDFSRGMLEVGKGKTSHKERICLVQADASRLPFKDETFDVVTCAHAFYELKGNAQDLCLKETVRVLKKGRSFLMMEHDIPKNLIIRILFYMRLLSMGSKRAIEILFHEEALLKRYFKEVTRLSTPSGRSKIMICKKGVKSTLDSCWVINKKGRCPGH